MTKRFRPHSLSMQLLRGGLVSLLASILAFGLIYSLGNTLLARTIYGERFLLKKTDDRFALLQEFITQEQIGENDLHRLDVWCGRSGRTYLTLLGRDGYVLYESLWAESLQFEPDEADRISENLMQEYGLILGSGTAVRARFFYFADEAWYYGLIVFSALAALLVFSICFVSFVSQKLRYIRQLKGELDVLAGGDLSYPVTIKGKDEISELASGIDQMRRSILSHQESEENMRSASLQLVTAMSHDLRTPLTSLLGYLELMDRGKYKDEEQLRHFIDRSLEKTLRIKEMADKLFEYFLVYSAERRPPDTELADALEVFSHFWNEYAFSLDSQGFQVHTDFEPINGQIRVNLDLLRRAFDNLYSNLLKYAEPTQPIEIAGTQEGARAVLTLENRISAQRDNRESTNIGLNTCRRILQELDGDFSCEESGGMFRVRLSLPLVGGRA